MNQLKAFTLAIAVNASFVAVALSSGCSFGPTEQEMRAEYESFFNRNVAHETQRRLFPVAFKHAISRQYEELPKVTCDIIKRTSLEQLTGPLKSEMRWQTRVWAHKHLTTTFDKRCLDMASQSLAPLRNKEH